MRNPFAIMALAAVALASPAWAQSYDPSVGSGNIVSVLPAPVGHRQPRAADVPATTAESSSASFQDRKLERKLRICRGC